MRSLLPLTVMLVLVAAPASAVLTDDEPENDDIATATIQMVRTGAPIVDTGKMDLVFNDEDFLGISNLKVGDRLTVATMPLDKPCPGHPDCEDGDFMVPDTMVGIFDASSNMLCVNDDAYNNDLDEPIWTGNGSLCRLVIAEDGDYYVGITGYTDPPFNDPIGHDDAGKYMLTVTIAPKAKPRSLCGLGAELAFILPPLIWLSSRRRQRAA